MGLVLLLFLCLLVFSSLYFFVAKTWWFQVGASSAAAGLDHQFVNTGIAMGIAFLVAQLGLGYILW